MNANLAVIVDNLDYLLWGRLADGIPGGVVLTLLMAIGAAALALPASASALSAPASPEAASFPEAASASTL